MSSKITQKAVLFSSDKQIHFSGAIHRVDTKGGEKYGTLQRISCMAYLFTPYICGCSGRSGAAFGRCNGAKPCTEAAAATLMRCWVGERSVSL